MLLVFFKASAAQDESSPMVTITNKNRYFLLRHRLHMLLNTIENKYYIKINPDTGKVTLPEIKSSASLRVDIMRQNFLENRGATLVAIHTVLKSYDTTEDLIIPLELLREISSNSAEYKQIIEEEELEKKIEETKNALKNLYYI
jgi:hypothetical protein